MKVGIVTEYYESINYGGNLQAYALCRFLNDNGIEAEQICYARNEGKVGGEQKKINKVALKRIQKKICKVLNKQISNIFGNMIVPNFK